MSDDETEVVSETGDSGVLKLPDPTGKAMPVAKGKPGQLSIFE